VRDNDQDDVSILPLIVFLFASGLGVSVWWIAAPPSPETVAKERICTEQGARNAKAWASFMRFKDPIVLCSWEEPAFKGCRSIMACSVGSENAIYGVRCTVGEGAEDEGRPERCSLTVAGKVTGRHVEMR
jgi:hypothetical protein